MAAISGFTADQNESLAGVEVGDIILIYQPAPAYVDEDSDNGSEDEDNDQDGGDDGSEEDGENAAENGNEDAAASSEHDSDESESSDEQFSDATSQPAEHDQDTDSTVESEDEPAPVHPTVFAICKIITSKSEEITDLSIVKLEYDSLPGTSGKLATYQLYGQQCEQTISADTLAAIASADKVLQVPAQLITDFQKPERLVIEAKPTGDLIRHLIHGRRCPAGCRNGFLNTLHDLHGMVKDFSINTTLEHRPVCPSCIGITLMKEHQALRETLEAFMHVDIGEVVEFFGRLNIRRGPLGYPFKQFDERDWGFMFDDMHSDEEGGEQGEQYETWDEAMEPNNNVIPHPASKETIDNLPRKTITQAADNDNNDCTICQETFTEGQTVVELPCKHVFCDSGCIEQWLGQFASCPTCRAKLPRADGKEDGESEDEDEDENAGSPQIADIFERTANAMVTPSDSHDMIDPVAPLLARSNGHLGPVLDDFDGPELDEETMARALAAAERVVNEEAGMYEDDSDNDTSSDGLATDEEDNTETTSTGEDTEMSEEIDMDQLNLFHESRNRMIAVAQEDAVMSDKE